MPKAATYDLDWLLRVSTVANVAWLTESLAQVMPFESGMRVLDLGCGRGGSSVFLAREYDVTVFAVDTMVRPDEILTNVDRFGLRDRVLPQRADARLLPFPARYFDAVVSIGAFQYFATDSLFLTELAKFVRHRGRVGMVCEGLVNEIDEPPAHYSPSWRTTFPALHTPDWWRRHWERAGFEVEAADLVPDGAERWAEWYELCIERGVRPRTLTEPEAAMLRADAGRTLGLVRAVARVD